jgi:two-component system chemotaxis response regulator CheB
MTRTNSTRSAWSETTIGAWDAVVIGTSAGGSRALAIVLPLLPAGYPAPVIIVQHLHPHQDTASFLVAQRNHCALVVKEAEDKEPIEPGVIYFAPPNYHLLIEDNRVFALSIDARVNFSRPSIDVLFESAADVYAPHLVGVILTGANQDGAAGLRRVKERGGLTVVLDPDTAEVSAMPGAALEVAVPDYVLRLDEIGRLLARMGARDTAATG